MPQARPCCTPPHFSNVLTCSKGVWRRVLMVSDQKLPFSVLQDQNVTFNLMISLVSGYPRHCLSSCF